MGTAMAAPPEYTGNIKDSLAVMLINADSGQVLYEQNADERVKPASTTKILTTILALENSSLDETVTVGSEGDWSSKEGMGYSLLHTKKNEVIKMKDLLYGMMLVSGDDAACAVAVHIGSKTDAENPMDAFVEMMNTKAKEIGMTESNFSNPGGVEDEDLYVTARDMSKLAIYAMKNSDFRDLVKTFSYTVEATNKHPQAQTVKNTNSLLDPDSEYRYEYATGIKTGSTSKAGGCLISSATKDGMNLICIVYNDQTEKRTDRWPISKSLYEWAFEKFETINVTTMLKPVEPVQIEDYAADDAKDGLLEFKQPEIGDIYATLSKEDAQALLDGTDTIEATTSLNKELVAPIAEGDIMGVVTYKIKSTGNEVYHYNLIASREVLEESASNITPVATLPPTPSKDVVPEENNTLFIIILVVIAGGLIAFLVVRMLMASRRRHFKKRRRPHYSYRK